MWMGLLIAWGEKGSRCAIWKVKVILNGPIWVDTHNLAYPQIMEVSLPLDWRFWRRDWETMLSRSWTLLVAGNELPTLQILPTWRFLTKIARLLLHTETPDGSVVPIWEEADVANVVVLKDIMASRRNANDVELYYTRIPITAERPPDFADLNELIDVVVRTDSSNTPIVVNCQLGRGRSTLTSVSIRFGNIILTGPFYWSACLR